MDDNAQVSSVQDFPSLDQLKSLANQSQKTPASSQTQQVADDQNLYTQQQNQTSQQQVSSPRAESRPTTSFDDDDRDDRQQVTASVVEEQPLVTAAKTEAPAAEPTMQVGHPEVEIQNELRQIGVAPGPDAKKEELPEAPEQLGDLAAQVPQPTAAPATDDILTMSYGEAQIAAKKERSIRNGISWMIREVLRHWKKTMEIAPEAEKEQKKEVPISET